MEYPGTSHLWTWPSKYQCKQANQSSDTKPQAMTVRLHKRNLIEWKTKAFHCQKIHTAASALVSFFAYSIAVPRWFRLMPSEWDWCCCNKIYKEKGIKIIHQNFHQFCTKFFSRCCVVRAKRQKYDHDGDYSTQPSQIDKVFNSDLLNHLYYTSATSTSSLILKI